MKEFLARTWAAILAAQKRRATQRLLRHLDARTLKDIGLEAYGRELPPDPLARRFDPSFGGLR